MDRPDPNKDEYRSLVTAPDQYELAVGALIEEENLTLTPGHDYHNIKTGDTYGQNLDHFMGQVVCFKQLQKNAARPDPIPHIMPGYKFNDCILVANSTCFYIGNGLIITAGHSVFEGEGPAIKAKVPRMKVVFGLTNANCNNKTIPAAKVFNIDRVCFGQNEPFPQGQQNLDRADWAIIKLAVDPASPQLPQPLALRPWAYAPEQISGAWTVGHPWGIGLTLSSPPNDKGYAATNGRNSLEHNLYVAPANSGGPLFSKTNEIIGIVASGMGDPIAGRGFLWVPSAKEIVPWIQPGQTFRATKTNICRSLTHTNMTCFIGLQLPTIQVTPQQKQLVVEILFGNGLEASWTSVVIINQQAVPNDRIQELINYPAIVATNANFRPWLIRAIRFNFTHPVAGGGGMGGGGVGGFQIPRIPKLIFGCMDTGDEEKPYNWTVLLSEADLPYDPGSQSPVGCPVFLPPAWKTITNDQMGPLDLTQWRTPSRRHN